MPTYKSLAKQNTKKGTRGVPKSPLQIAGSKLVDELGKRGIESLKRRLGLNTETKTIGYNTSATTTTTLSRPVTMLSNPIAQGDTESTRNGSTIRVTSYRLRYAVRNGAANLSPDTTVRVIVCSFRPGNGAAPTTNYASVLENGTVTGWPEVLSRATLRDNQTYKNSIVHDRTYVLGQTGTFPTVQLGEFDWRPNEFHLEWTPADATGVIANSIGQMLAVYVIASTATAGNFPVVEFTQDVDYVDN